MSDPEKKGEAEEAPERTGPFAHIENIAENNSAKINEKYLQRISFVRRGRDFFIKGDVKNTIVQYNLYFQALANFYGVTPEEISPKLFNNNTDTSEALLITQVSWDLARIYENSEKFDQQFKHSLNLFINFSMGYKFQVANAEMLRKFIMKNPRNKNIELYKTGYNKIKVISKKCFVATHCFGEQSAVTESYRELRRQLIQYEFGLAGIRFYNRHSPRLVQWLKRHPVFDFVFVRCLIKPLLWVFSKIINTTIL